MRSSWWRWAVFAALGVGLTCPTAQAQLPETVQFGEPVLGYVADPARNGIRAVRGYGQSAWVGSLFPITLALTNVTASPGAKFFLLQSDMPRRAWVLTGTGDIFGIQTPPEPGNTKPWRVAFSPQGSYTVIYRETDRRAWIYSKLLQPGFPPVAVILPIEPTHLAISDDGTRLLQASKAGLHLLDNRGRALLLDERLQPDAVRFAEGTHVGLAIDKGQFLRLMPSSAEASGFGKEVLAKVEGMTGPLALVRDGKAWAARVGSEVVQLNLAGKVLQRVASPCPIVEIAATTDPTSALITGSGTKHCLLDMADGPATIRLLPGAPVRPN